MDHDIHKRVSHIQWILLSGILVLSWQIHGLRVVADANASRLRVAAEVSQQLADRNERAILNFMSRTVDRWDALQRNNPNLAVPKVVEPLTTPHLDTQDLKRP